MGYRRARGGAACRLARARRGWVRPGSRRWVFGPRGLRSWAGIAALVFVWTALLGGATLGCDGGSCTDLDADGYGAGCAMGADCDDQNAARNVDCAQVAAPDCDADPAATGCPCLPRSVRDCLVAEGVAGVGLCKAGRTTCVNGFWGLCAGGVGPEPERCDGEDQDCDGRSDEGVLSPCGGCSPQCMGAVWGEGTAPFEAGEGLALTERLELTLDTVDNASGHVFVANSAEGTLSKLDAASAVEVARYPTGGREPSRVAVDWAGDAWVLNREFGGVSTATKVAGPSQHCVDRTGDGIQTSGGPADVLPLADDECILLHVAVGASGEVARALAIDGDRGLDGGSGGNAWVGLHDGMAIVQLDGINGQPRRRVETPDFAPYAMTFDRRGRLWAISRDGLLARVDPGVDPPGLEIIPVPLACYLLYGIAVDDEGRLLMTGFSCDRVARYDPRTDRWSTLAVPASPRGVASAGGDRMWIAHTEGRVSELTVSPLSVVRTFSLDGLSTEPFESIGIAVDAFGDVWVASGQGGAGGVGLATRVAAEAGTVSAQVPVGRAPHVQGDLSGQRVRRAFVPRGSASRVFTGCEEGGTTWSRLHLFADLGAQGSILVEARHGASGAQRSAAAFETIGRLPADTPPLALSYPAGGEVEVRVTLGVEGAIGAPVLQRLGVEWTCPGSGPII